MLNVLTNEEIEQLSQFRFTTEKKPSELSIPLSELLEEKKLLCYLEKVRSHIGAPNLKVTASIFAKRYAFLAVIYFYSITAWNKKLDISFHNIMLQTEEADLWLPKFYFQNTQTEIAQEDRDDRFEKWLAVFFSEHTNVLITQLANVTKQSKLVLWENIAVYLFWLYESVLAQCDNQQLKVRAKEDFDYIVNESSGILFGGYDENPIKRYYCDKSCMAPMTTDEVRVRTTCCFSYLLGEGCKTCKTCPRTCGKRPLN